LSYPTFNEKAAQMVFYEHAILYLIDLKCYDCISPRLFQTKRE